MLSIGSGTTDIDLWLVQKENQSDRLTLFVHHGIYFNVCVCVCVCVCVNYFTICTVKKNNVFVFQHFLVWNHSVTLTVP